MALASTPKSPLAGEDPSTMTPRLRQDFFARMSEKRSSLRWTGWLAIVAGALAILFPLVGTLTVNAFAALALIVSGGVMVWMAFSHTGWSLAGYLASGALSVLGGLILLAFPAVGVFWLTVMLAAVFAAEGAMQIASGLKLRPEGAWGWMVGSGAVSILVAALILFLIGSNPASVLVMLGLFLGFNLVTTGIALVMLAAKLAPERLSHIFPDPRGAAATTADRSTSDPQAGNAKAGDPQDAHRDVPADKAVPIPPTAIQ